MTQLTEKQKKILGKYSEMADTSTGDPDVDRVARIRSTMTTDTGMFADTKQAFTDIKESASNRMDTTQDIFNAKREGKQGLLRSAGQLFGQGAGLASDVMGSTIMGAVKQLTPDAIQKPIGGAVEGVAGAVVNTEPVQKLVSWYSSLDEAKKRDIDAVLGTAGLATDIIGGGLAKKPITQVAKKTAQVTGDVVSPTIKAIGKGTADIVGDIAKPENIMQRVARINPTEQSKFVKMSGKTVGEYLTERKIFGSAEDVVTKLVDIFQKSKQMADDALATLKGSFRPAPIKSAIDQLLRREVSISSKGAMSKDLKTVMRLKNKFLSEGLTMSEINDVKRLYERNVKLGYSKLIEPEKVAKATNIDTAIRNWQVKKAEELGLKNLPEINKETQLSKALADALGKKLAGQAANNAVTLTDWIILAGGDPTAIGGFIGKKLMSSGKIQGKMAEVLSKGKKTKVVAPKFGKPIPTLQDFLSK